MTMQNDTSMACASGSDISVLISIHKGENDKYNWPTIHICKVNHIKVKIKIKFNNYFPSVCSECKLAAGVN